MKKIYFSILLITALGLGSCTKDFIDLTPILGKQEVTTYKTENEAYLALVACYDALSWQNANFGPLTADIRSDDSFAGGANANDWISWQQEESWIMNGENQAGLAMWQRCYWGIYRTNMVLDKAPSIAWINPANKTRFIAEAKFLRAYFYWDLARHFGWVPILTSVITDQSVLASMSQATPDQVYAQVAKDLLAAIADLPATVPATETGRITKYAAQALLARIFLYYDGFVKNTLAITAPWSDGTTTIDKAYATAALESVISSNKYQLLANYADVFSWTNQNNSEELFSFQYNGMSGASDWTDYGTNGGQYTSVNGNFTCTWLAPRTPSGDPNAYSGWSFSVPTFTLAAEFEAGDPRMAASLYDANTKLKSYTPGFQNTGYFNNKFMGNGTHVSPIGEPAMNFSLNYPDIRYSDVLLMAAELNLGVNNQKAVNYFNTVRTRALGSNAAKQSITIDDIYHERRVELSGEGLRYWDLLRRGLDYAATAINASFANIPTDRANVNATDFTPRNFKKTTLGMFPIPNYEIRQSSALKQYIPAYQ